MGWSTTQIGPTILIIANAVMIVFVPADTAQTKTLFWILTFAGNGFLILIYFPLGLPPAQTLSIGFYASLGAVWYVRSLEADPLLKVVIPWAALAGLPILELLVRLILFCLLKNKKSHAVTKIGLIESCPELVPYYLHRDEEVSKEAWNRILELSPDTETLIQMVKSISNSPATNGN